MIKKSNYIAMQFYYRFLSTILKLNYIVCMVFTFMFDYKAFNMIIASVGMCVGMCVGKTH